MRVIGLRVLTKAADNMLGMLVFIDIFANTANAQNNQPAQYQRADGLHGMSQIFTD